MNLQELIDSSDLITIKKGVYETLPIYIKSNKTIIFEEGVIIKPILSDDYKLINTRVAGINMMWYPAIINIIDAENVVLKGHAIIDGCGEYFWDKYWGSDLKGGMRAEYDKLGLRWACDYDCKRLRSILIQSSKNIQIFDLELFRSGFWNLHILYSHDILVKGIKIRTIDKESPSTDGIDIDSSYNVLIDSCNTDCYDDSICIKSGRDYDGIKTAIPCHDIEIKNCTINKGFGITIGSEVSGGIYNINIHDNSFNGTDCGFRIKSSGTRKGYIKNINVKDLALTNVKYIFNLVTEWNPLYNSISLPEGIKMKKEWENILHPVDSTIPNTIIDGINIENVVVNTTKDSKISRLFNIIGFDDMPMRNIKINNLKSKTIEYGIIKNADVEIINSDIKYDMIIDNKNDEFDTR
ncbi:MAG: hypothetical protein K6G48_01005 [Acholeplasmatales bacterium]|nr:hypothetical protein [Acholeplasmatales bacterium]